MNIEYTKSFERSLKALPEEIKAKTKEKIFTLLDSIQTGQKPGGLGLKKLKLNFWEIRVNIRIRVIFQIDSNVIRLVFAGSHDQLKRFLQTL